ncbi:MAG: MoaD/ThiS family protein [Thermodesulfobacteriota bacterium]
MTVKVKLSSVLRGLVQGYQPDNGLDYDLEPGRTVAQLLESLGIPAKKVKIIMVNGHHASLDQALSDGDRVGLFPPVGGG